MKVKGKWLKEQKISINVKELYMYVQSCCRRISVSLNYLLHSYHAHFKNKRTNTMNFILMIINTMGVEGNMSK